MILISIIIPASNMGRQKNEKRALLLLGALIRKYRIAKGISQEELGFLCGLDRSYIGGVERGERNISFVNLVYLAKGLGVSLRELLDEFDSEHE